MDNLILRLADIRQLFTDGRLHSDAECLDKAELMLEELETDILHATEGSDLLA